MVSVPPAKCLYERISEPVELRLVDVPPTQPYEVDEEIRRRLQFQFHNKVPLWCSSCAATFGCSASGGDPAWDSFVGGRCSEREVLLPLLLGLREGRRLLLRGLRLRQAGWGGEKDLLMPLRSFGVGVGVAGNRFFFSLVCLDRRSVPGDLELLLLLSEGLGTRRSEGKGREGLSGVLLLRRLCSH